MNRGPRRLTKSRQRVLCGVAGGFAEYLNLDPTLVRIIWVVLCFASFGFALLLYIICCFIMPQK